jgi:uncharacterized PurR-regulated membrane protein YhhQ (DUF165 family)
MTPRGRFAFGATAITAYVAAIVTANWLTARYGFIPVGFGLTATAGTYAAGFAFVFRNLTQEAFGRAWVLAAIVAGAALSWWLSVPALAIASGVTFLVSETADWAVYTPLRRRGWMKAAAAGNVCGFTVDTFLFLYLAGFPVLAAAPGQLLGKAYATVIYLAIGWAGRRAVLRHAVRPAGA